MPLNTKNAHQITVTRHGLWNHSRATLPTQGAPGARPSTGEKRSDRKRRKHAGVNGYRIETEQHFTIGRGRRYSQEDQPEQHATIDPRQTGSDINDSPRVAATTV